MLTLPLNVVKRVLKDFNQHRCQTTAIFGTKKTGWYGDKWFWLQLGQHDLPQLK